MPHTFQYDSGISALTLATQMIAEIDVTPIFQQSVVLRIIDELEQLLYEEIIQESDKIIVEPDDTTSSPIEVNWENEGFEFKDVYSVYVLYHPKPIQLLYSSDTLVKSNNYNYLYCENGNKSILFTFPVERSGNIPIYLTIYYYVRPDLKSSTGHSNDTIKVPIEFIDLFKTKIRGEIYKLANEDELAAKWLNDYNVLLENFKVWVAKRQANFGN